MTPFKIYASCPMTTVKFGFDQPGVPLEMLLHMTICENCREIILESPPVKLRRVFDPADEEKNIKVWENVPDAHPSATEIYKLIKLKLTKKSSQKIATHMESCSKCRDLANNKRRKTKPAH